MKCYINYSIVLLLIIIFFAYTLKSNLAFYLNFASKIEPFFVNFTDSKEEYPQKGMIVNITDYSTILQRNFNNFIKCGKGINESFKSNKTVCNEYVLNKKAIYLKSHHAVLQNVWVNNFGTWAYKNEFIRLPGWMFTKWCSRGRHDRRTGYVDYIVDELIFTGEYESHKNFGHFHNDWLQPLMIIPEEIRERCYISYNTKPSFIKEGLLAIGFREEQLLPQKRGNWIIANKFHTVIDKRAELNYFGITCVLFHEKVTETFKLNEIYATKYGLSNRKKGQWRSITNFQDFVDSTKQTFPDIDWKEVNDYFPTLKDTAKEWASYKLICLPTGSNCMKALYMKSKSVLVVGSSDGLDESVLFCCCSCGVFVYYFPVPGMKHFGDTDSKNYYNITIAINALRNGIYCAKNGNWPPIEF